MQQSTVVNGAAHKTHVRCKTMSSTDSAPADIATISQVTPGSPGKPGRSVERSTKKLKDSLGRAKEVTPLKPPKVRVSTGVCMQSIRICTYAESGDTSTSPRPSRSRDWWMENLGGLLLYNAGFLKMYLSVYILLASFSMLTGNCKLVARNRAQLFVQLNQWIYRYILQIIKIHFLQCNIKWRLFCSISQSYHRLPW